MKRRPLVSSQGLGCSGGSGLQLFRLQGKSAFLLQRGQWERGGRGRSEARSGWDRIFGFGNEQVRCQKF